MPPDAPSRSAIPQPPAMPAGYLQALRSLHRIFPDYGTGNLQFAHAIIRQVHALGFRSILDYGCGKGGLVAALSASLAPHGVFVTGYDPAVPAFAAPPPPCDLVLCIDTLDSIPRILHAAVLRHIAALARSKAFLAIAVETPGLLTSAAGEVIQRVPLSREEWRATIAAAFDIATDMDWQHWAVFVGRPRSAIGGIAA